VFALKEDVASIVDGTLNPEPLILRANVGEVVEVTLHNHLQGRFHNNDNSVHDYPGVPVETVFPPSCRISLHAQLLVYDVRFSDGATVGFNPDQTVGPNESITYRWYIDQQIGSVNLWDMADIRNHRHHGAFGMLITEMRGSKYLDSVTGEEVERGSQVIIDHPLGDFREFALLMHDGVRLYDRNGNLIIDPEPPLLEFTEPNALANFEDQGSRGFNYRAERFKHRLANVLDISKVFSSSVHGDPSTPVFLAHVGDPVVIRFVFPADRARAHSFTVHGHHWLRSDDDLNSEAIAVQGQNTVGTADDFVLLYGAGGLLGVPGDYMYRSGNIRWDIELGVWGIMRVLDRNQTQLVPLKINSI
jgi:hypothetical protein